MEKTIIAEDTFDSHVEKIKDYLVIYIPLSGGNFGTKAQPLKKGDKVRVYVQVIERK